MGVFTRALTTRTLSLSSSTSSIDRSHVSISLLLAGSGPSLQQAASHAATCHPSVSQVLVLVADSDKFTHPLAEPWAKLLELVQQNGSYSHIVATSGSFGKNILPRATAFLDVSPITDVIEISSSSQFVSWTCHCNEHCSTRAAVDAGFVPNDLQVGQTGKIVAPELYMAFDVSDTIQHKAGMRDSKVIVAVNKDAKAPIFQVVDYGLVGDLFEVIPELMEKLPEKK